MTTHIEVQNLRKEFGSLLAVDDISFDVGVGDVLGFLGPNGAGKSTTMKMITGFLTPTSGRSIVCGFDVGQQPVAAKEKIGYLPEGAPLYPEMTPASFLGFIAEIRGLSGEAKKRRLGEVAEQIQIKDVWRQPIETLSKGYKRRVGLAQAILHDPEVLILDEPTDGLDPNQKQEVRQLVKTMAATKAIIISTHILEEVDAVCSRALIIANGRIVADGTPQQLAARSPRHRAVSLRVDESDAPALDEALSRIIGVDKIESVPEPEGVVRLTALPAEGATIFQEISELLHSGTWRIRELTQETGRLERVFHDLTAPTLGEQGGQG
ncbi:MAG TPA: ABC transporter ATP-binding protein [Desulfuromonadales bacterium]|nr:ABC transporter ATP-binding protein [Desulfuromonadales bacterium]